MNAFMRKGDFWSGLVLAALGVYIVSEAAKWVYIGEDGPGAGFFPIWYGAAMVVLSLLLVAGAVMKVDPAKKRDIGKEGGANKKWGELSRAFACWIAFALCIALMHVVGFVIAFALLTWFIAGVMFKKSQKIALPLAIGGALSFWVVFSWALDISLPPGILF